MDGRLVRYASTVSESPEEAAAVSNGPSSQREQHLARHSVRAVSVDRGTGSRARRAVDDCHPLDEQWARGDRLDPVGGAPFSVARDHGVMR